MHCEKIMVYKLKEIRYSIARKKMVFYFHTPVTRNFCGGKSDRLSLAYESVSKAERLISKME